MNNEKIVRNFRILSVIGIFLSTYATYVEINAEKYQNYAALCDIAPKISCTAVFSSIYGRGFGILQTLFKENDWSWMPPNGEFGIIFYSFLFISSLWHHLTWLSFFWLFLAVITNLLSIYLAYLLYFVLENFCFICVSIYVLNYYLLKQIWHIHKNNKIQNLLKNVQNQEECQSKLN